MNPCFLMTSKFLIRNEDGEFQLCSEKSSGPKYYALNQLYPFYLPTPKLSTHIPTYLPTSPSTHPPSHYQSPVITIVLSSDGVISIIHLCFLKSEYFWYTHAVYTGEMDLTICLTTYLALLNFTFFAPSTVMTITEHNPTKCTLFILML